MELLVLLFSVLTILVLAILVITQGPNQAHNRRFAFLSFMIVLWAIGNYLSDTATQNILLYTRMTFSAGVFSIYAAVLFFMYFPENISKKHFFLGTQHLLASLSMLVVSFLPQFITGVTSDTHEIQTGYLYPVFLAYVIYSFGMLIYAIVSQFRHARTRLVRRQLVLIAWGMTLYAILSLSASVVIPLLTGQWFASQFSPAYTIVLCAAVAYSIVKHGLFDIKLAAVRSAAYLLTLATLGFLYYVIAYVVSVTIFREDVSTSTLSVSPLNIAFALVLAFIFQPVKQFFDRITDQLFYRDRYDANEFITRLGRVLTSTTRLHDVIEKAGYEIATTLKAGGSMIVVYRDHHADAVASWRMKNHFTDEEHDHLKSAATHFGGGLLVVESLQRMHTHEARRLHALLAKRNVAVVLPLVTVDETIGYLLLEEQMGSGYAKRDLEVLEAIADSLVIAIQNARSVQVVRDLNTHLEQRVNSATKELRASNKRLVELDATKDEFVSMASHQLRTPLTSIKGYLSMVLEGDVGKITPDQRQLLSEAFTSSERMVHLIGDFLNVSRLQTGKFVIDRRETDLSAVVSQEVESMKQIAEAHGMSITYRKPSVFPQLYIDDNKLRQVIMNFIDNAIYYSPESRAPIKVKLSVEDGDAVFRVMDRGMGVPAEVQKQLFGKFFRAENARKQRPDGTGIGLYLAKKVIDGHSGKLVFESAEGKGSTFGFRLPVRKLSQPPVERTNDDSEIK